MALVISISVITTDWRNLCVLSVRMSILEVLPIPRNTVRILINVKLQLHLWSHGLLMPIDNRARENLL